MTSRATTVSRRRRWALIGLAVLAAIAVGVLAAYQYASRSLQERVLEALGPESEVDRIRVRLTDVELTGIRVKAPKGWPAETALRAERVVITPQFRYLLSDRVRITDVRIEKAYISALRPKSGGGLRILPNQKERVKNNQDDGRRGAVIDAVHLEDCTIELFDATVALKPTRVRIDGVTGTVKDIEIPDLSARTQIALEGVLQGPQHRGTVSVRGWVDADKKSAEIGLQVRNVDLALFEPYVVTKTKAGIDSGTFNLDIKSTVRNNVVHAPGTLTLSGIRLESSENPVGALASVPRRAAIGALADDNERISVPFNLEGSLDDPTFSITGKTALQTGVALVKALGLSFEGLARAFLIILNGFGGAFGSTLGGA